MKPRKSQSQHIVSNLRPLHRVLLSLLLGALAFWGLQLGSFPFVLNILISWIVFCILYLSICWYIIYTTPIEAIIQKASMEDGSRIYVSSFILVASFGCLVAVLSIIISAKTVDINKVVLVIVSVLSMIFSWLLVHTLYLFHYAHLYYKEGQQGQGLDFPGKEQPDYLDFAYFSLCMGCTFQVSDVEISGQKIRRVAMYHGLLSFALNTFVVALTINMVAGLIN